jgi:quercetin dioxygenase-like cupin family protein
MKLEIAEWEDRGVYRVAKGFDIGDGCFIQLVEIKPKSKVEKHYHKKQTEVFVILRGEARLGIGEEVYDAKAGDVFLCEPEKRHWVENEKDGTFLILVFKYNWAEDDIFWE